jgi:tetratricopeptide (TPR) repeat protein
MNLPFRYFTLCLFVLFTCGNTFAQTTVIDSLRKVLKTEQDDTNKVNTLKALSDKLRRTGKYDTALATAFQAKTLAEKLEYQKGIAGVCTIIGVVYRIQGTYAKALEFDFKALSIYESIKDKNGTAICLGNIGLVYWNQSSLTKALNYDYRALAMYQAMKDKKGIARNLGNIGIVYFEQRDFAQALEYDLKALALDQELGDMVGISANLGDIGNIYTEQGNYPKALEYDFKALALDEKIGDRNGIGRNQGNIGNILLAQKKFKLAKLYLDSALDISKALGDKVSVKDAYGGFLGLDTITGNYKTGLEDYKKYIAYTDSLVNEENTKKTVQAEMNFEFTQKQAAQKAEQEKKDAISAADKKRQSIIMGSVSAGLVVVLLFSVLLFSRYKLTQRQKKIIEEQKSLVEEKNKEVLDSITYAKRLQDAILPPLSFIKHYLPESFVLYKPKDIVAGDFYWMERAGDSILIAAADCTGHGVPGAMVSVVCSNALNRTVKEFKITETGKILDKVRELVLETFEKSESNVQDGMDISLCCINSVKHEIQWSGAYNPLWYIRNGVLIEVMADKQPIGKTDKPLAFTTHNLKLQSGSALYLFTDGYADQFGGEKGKKFKYKQLQEFLLANATLPMDLQKNKLEVTLDGWKGNLEQVDDILVIGIRI